MPNINLQNQTDDPKARLAAALDIQRKNLIPYEQPSEVLAFETLRAVDDLFIRDLMEPNRPVGKEENLFRSISTWGVNNAFKRIIPKDPQNANFRAFPSDEIIQGQADDFIFNCAILELGERYKNWLSEGILEGEVRHHEKPSGELWDALVLKAQIPSFLDEEIGISGLKQSSHTVWLSDRKQELGLEKRHRKMARDLEKYVKLLDGWFMTFSTTGEIDDYFMEWAKLYLRRIFSQDLIGPDDLIGGRPFSRYIDVLSALSARSQKHLAYAAILHKRYCGNVHVRNLITTFSDRDYFLTSLSGYLGADRSEIAAILESLTLSASNLNSHTDSGDIVWAPIVQASEKTLLLPAYGLDINPFLFLFKDLRHRHEKDWFRISNEREGRWVEEIEQLFNGPRWQTHKRNLKIHSDGKVITDIDFAVLDRKANQLALFQLKWQQPVGLDNRTRRSAGKNLISESNQWIEKVLVWLDKNSVTQIIERLGFETESTPTVYLFVLGRYHVHFTGFENHDGRASWSDWAHFKQMRLNGRHRSISQLTSDLRQIINRSRINKMGESLAFPVGDLSVIINPTSTPDYSPPGR